MKQRDYREYIRTVISYLEISEPMKWATIKLLTGFVGQLINRQSAEKYGKMEGMNIDTMTEIEKKATIYDNLAMIEQCQSNIKLIQQSMQGQKEITLEVPEKTDKEGK